MTSKAFKTRVRGTKRQVGKRFAVIPKTQTMKSKLPKVSGKSKRHLINTKLNRDELKVKAYCLKEAIKDRRESERNLKNKNWMNTACNYSKKHAEEEVKLSVEEIARRKFKYLKYRAESGIDSIALNEWNKITRSPNSNISKETSDAFYFKTFPSNRFYVIRWLGDGGYHYYPESDGKRPHGFSSRAKAEADISVLNKVAKVVSGFNASKYPVPKRS